MWNLVSTLAATLNLQNSETLVEGESWLTLQQEFNTIGISILNNVIKH